jgi:hypothetical protein
LAARLVTPAKRWGILLYRVAASIGANIGASYRGRL